MVKTIFFIFTTLFLATKSLLSSEIIENIVFQGNKKVKSHLLLSVIASKKKDEFSEGRLEIDKKSLLEFYRTEGFFDTKIAGNVIKGKRGKVIIWQIEEGERTRIDSIIFLGKKDYRVARLLKKRGYGFYSAARIRELEDLLREFYLNSGYYYVDLRIDTSLVGGNRMNLIIRVDEGPVTYIKEIKFRGLVRVRKKDALRISELKKGESYNQKKLYEAARKLYATNLFENIYFKVSPLPRESTSRESLEIRFDCQELKERIFGFGIGYVSPPQRTYHSLTWQHLNFFRRAHIFHLLFEISPDWQGSYNLVLKSTYRIPYISQTKINFASQPFFILDVDKKEAKRIWELGAETGFYYDLTRNLQANITNKYRRLWGSENAVHLCASEASDSLPGQGLRITNSLNLKLLYDTRDDFFSPNAGLYSFSLVEYGGGLLGGSANFYRFSQEIRYFLKLFSILAFRFSTGIIIPHHQTESIPNYEKFYLGGMTTLRGYDEKSMAGDGVLLLNFENRFPLYKTFSGVAFADFGFTKNRNQKEIAYDTGIGLRLGLPIGPLRLDYAVVPKRFKEKNWWKINFGLGNVF